MSQKPLPEESEQNQKDFYVKLREKVTARYDKKPAFTAVAMRRVSKLEIQDAFEISKSFIAPRSFF